jgi:hypothetical protein
MAEKHESTLGNGAYPQPSGISGIDLPDFNEDSRKGKEGFSERWRKQIFGV